MADNTSSGLQGRLELTWTNKHLRLLADEDGGYKWVPASDYRVAEVRLLDNADFVGDPALSLRRAADNLLIRGDALNALTSLSELPEFAEELVGKVKLAYLDPPFNTQQAFSDYDDALEHSVWLTMMRDRLAQLRKLLSTDGSVWVHLDDKEMAYCKVVLDELFGRQNFVASIAWEKAPGTRGDTDIAATHDHILLYARDKRIWKETRNLLPRTDEQMDRYRNPDNDPRGPWRQGADGRAKSGDEENQFPVMLPSGRVVTPGRGMYWRFTKQRLERAREEGRVWFGIGGNSLPIIKTYLSEAQEGVVPKTWWPSAEVGSNQEAKRDHIRKLFPDREPFATPKPERLLRRIIHIATNPGDIILDCFLGSGTTAAVAQKMGRRWVGIEQSAATLSDFAIPRLEKVIRGEDPFGVTDLTGWTGGGAFRVLGVALSMFSEDGGMVYLADWATNGRLAEACAAQLHFDLEFDPPFAGRRGRMRLAVVDGLVNADAIRLLVNVLADDERLTVCGTAVDPDVRQLLRELRPGSAARKIPQAILEDYRLVRWLPRETGAPEVGAESHSGAPNGEAGEAEAAE